MRFCTTCGRSFEDDVEVCPHDGTPLFGSSSDDEAPSSGEAEGATPDTDPGEESGGRREAEESERLKSSEGAGIVGADDVRSESGSASAPSALELLEEDDGEAAEPTSASEDSTLDTDEMEELPLDADDASEPSGPDAGGLEVRDEEGDPRSTAMGMPGVGATEQEDTSEGESASVEEVGQQTDEDLPDLGEPMGGPAPSPLDDPQPETASGQSSGEPQEVDLDEGDQASDQIMAGIEDTLGEFDEDSQADGPAAQPLELERDDIEVEPAPPEDDRPASTAPTSASPGDASSESGGRRGLTFAALVILLSAAGFGYFAFGGGDLLTSETPSDSQAVGEPSGDDQPGAPTANDDGPKAAPESEETTGAVADDAGTQADVDVSESTDEDGDSATESDSASADKSEGTEESADDAPTGSAAQPGGAGGSANNEPDSAPEPTPSRQPTERDQDQPAEESADTPAPAEPETSPKEQADRPEPDEPESQPAETDKEKSPPEPTGSQEGTGGDEEKPKDDKKSDGEEESDSLEGLENFDL